MSVNKEKYTPQEIAALEEIASYKWKYGYNCRLCGGTKYYKGKTPYSRKCQNIKCKKDESATANTVFERLRISIDAALALVRIISSQKRFYEGDELIDVVEKRTSIKLKPKAVWELMLKIYDNMEVEPVEYERDVLVINFYPVSIMIGVSNGRVRYSACISKQVNNRLNFFTTSVDCWVVYQNGEILRGKGKKTMDLYDWMNVVTRYQKFNYQYEDENEVRTAAYLGLFAFILNGYSYTDLMKKLTTGYVRNELLLYQRR